jgi:hypothetical protein
MSVSAARLRRANSLRNQRPRGLSSTARPRWPRSPSVCTHSQPVTPLAPAGTRRLWGHYRCKWLEKRNGAGLRPGLSPTGRRAEAASGSPRSGCRGAVAGQQQRTVEVDDVGKLAHQHGRRHGQRGGEHAADHDLEVVLARRGGQRQGLGEAAGLVQLDVDGVVFADEFASPSRSWALSSAHTAMGRLRRASLASSAAGSGCSMSSTPASHRRQTCAADRLPTSLHWHRRTRRACGAARRTASSRSASPGAPSFSLSSGRAAARAALAAMAAGESRLKV